MYLYIYDSFLSDKKFERVISSVETRLTDLGISGKIGRLTAFTNARGLIRDEVKRGVQTVVVVGNDETVAKVIEGIDDAPVTLGIIPVGAPLSIARALGIPEGVDACDVLSRRVAQKIDLGMINGRLFLSEVRIPFGNMTIVADGMYRITAFEQESEIVVSNLSTSEIDGADPSSGNPRDGLLDTVISPKAAGFFSRMRRGAELFPSIIPLRKLSISSEEPISVLTDGRICTHQSISIEVVPERLRVITGRERAFA